MSQEFRGVVWLDRDGTVVDDPGYLDDPAQLRLLPGAADAVARLRRAGWAVVLITNQSGIGRGLMSQATVDAIHVELKRRLAEVDGGGLDGIYLCPHLPAELMSEGEAACDCRKPAPGMIHRAMDEMGLAGLPQVGVGDKAADLDLAKAVGALSVLVLTGEGRATRNELGADLSADHVAENLAEAASWILSKLDLAT